MPQFLIFQWGGGCRKEPYGILCKLNDPAKTAARKCPCQLAALSLRGSRSHQLSRKHRLTFLGIQGDPGVCLADACAFISYLPVPGSSPLTPAPKRKFPCSEHPSCPMLTLGHNTFPANICWIDSLNYAHVCIHSLVRANCVHVFSVPYSGTNMGGMKLAMGIFARGTSITLN